MKYYLIAGEASGDLHGASLMRALRTHDEHAVFRYFGGDHMQAEGGTLARHIRELAFMGFVEVVMNLRTIFKNLSFARTDMLHFNPDVLILVDFPGFNLKIAAFAKKKGIPVFYYISPKVWAWNQKRVLTIRRVVDRMFCILPFEVDFYGKWGMKVDYIGNPLLDAIAAHRPDPSFREKNRLAGKPLLALLPGSRKQEITRLLPEMAGAMKKFPDHQPVIAGAPNMDASLYQARSNGRAIPVIFNSTYDLLLHSSAAVVTSGTATLEAALFQVPQVVVYKGNPLTIAIARYLIQVGSISLVNLIMDREVVKELIQEKCTSVSIAAELARLLKDDGRRTKMSRDYEELASIMGNPGASARAAKLMLKYMEELR